MSGLELGTKKVVRVEKKEKSKFKIRSQWDLKKLIKPRNVRRRKDNGDPETCTTTDLMKRTEEGYPLRLGNADRGDARRTTRDLVKDI